MGDDESKADEDVGIGFDVGKLSPKIFVVLDLVGLGDRKAELQSALLKRRCRQLHAAVTRSVRLRNHQTNMESGFDQFLQGWHSEARGSSEDEVEWLRHRKIAPLRS